MRVAKTTPLWIAARDLLSGKGDDFFRLREQVLATADPEEIHDLRVASRRLREGLALFSPCYPPEETARLGKAMKRVTRHLGAMRNTDEALAFFSALAEELDDCCREELKGLIRSFAARRDKGLKGFKAGLRRCAPPALRRDFLRTINSPRLFAPPVPGVDLLAPVSLFAANTVTGRLAAVAELLPAAKNAGEIEAQHRLRIAVKHFRYRLELLSFQIEAGFPEILATLKGYQEVLGKMHDLDVFAGIAREAGFAADAGRLVLARIRAKRERLFAGFAEMVTAVPFEEIGARIRSAG